MDLVIHHLKKDIRQLRSLLALWFLLLLVNSLLLRSGLDRFVASDEGVEVLATAYVLLYVLQQIVQIVIVCQLVQADALAGTTAFWLTRPISRKELLLSKSLFVLLILVLPSLLAEVIVLRINGISVSSILSALAEEVILQGALFLVPAMLVAVLTPNLVRLVVAGLASVTAFFLIHYTVLATVMGLGHLEEGWFGSFRVIGRESFPRAHLECWFLQS
jgi:ABC-type transport system involved in multi-copper enzyme maturation permease subunit